MNLLDTASLVVTPNGYKASKLYSIIPSDGSGDMTFARTGDTATRVNSSGLIETVLANKPRLDYLGSTCPKLLLEPQRTNLLTYSDAFDNATWSKINTTISANAVASPDGTTNADKIVAGTTSVKAVARGISAGTISVSVFAKAAEYGGLFLAVGNIGAFFNLTTGAFRANYNTAPTSTDIQSFGNGWYRCTINLTIASSDTLYIGPNDNISNSAGQGFTGNNVNGIYIYGAQVEAGAYATSYIPTTTASVTRNQDQCSKSSATALIGQTEGTMFVDYVYKSLGHDIIVLMLDNNSSSSIYFYVYGSTNNLLVDVINGGSLQASFTGITLVNGTRYKIAIGYKANDFVLYVNGVQRGSDSSGTVPTLSYLNVGRYTSAGDTYYNQYNSLSLWKTRLTNQELVTLTTI